MLKKVKIKSLFIFSLIFISILVVVFGVVLLFFAKNTLETSLINRGKTEIASLMHVWVDSHIPIETFSEPDVTKTQPVFDKYFHEIKTDEMLRIKVWDKNARIISANDPTIVGKTFSDHQLFQKAIKGETVVELKPPIRPENIKEQGYGQLMEVYVPIVNSNGEVVGIVEVYTIVDNLNRQIFEAQKGLTFVLISISIPTIALLSTLFFGFYRKILHSIDTLVQYTKVIGGGQLDEKTNFQLNDELSEVAVAMEKMSNDLNNSLITKTQLEKQVKDRTGELQSKVEEVERINKLMVNRELQMLELKKEITHLKGLPENTSK